MPGEWDEKICYLLSAFSCMFHMYIYMILYTMPQLTNSIFYSMLVVVIIIFLWLLKCAVYEQVIRVKNSWGLRPHTLESLAKHWSVSAQLNIH